MKAPESIIWMSLLALLSCQPSEQDPVNPPEEVLYPVTFSLLLKEEVLPFPGTKNIPPLDMPEPTAVIRTDGSEKELEDLCCTIEYFVFKNDEFIKNKSYNKEELDFGIISDQLPRGNYDIIIVAHNSTPATRSGNKLAFGEVSDTFYFSHYIEIEPGEQNVENITLYRVVGKIEFVSTDIVPANAKQFSIQLDQHAHLFNLKTGHGELVEEESPLPFTYPLDEHIGETNLTHGFFTFIPETGITLTAELKATDTEDGILRERTVENITPEVNKIIRYSGRLYNSSHSDDEFTIIIDENGEWGQTANEDLGD